MCLFGGRSILGCILGIYGNYHLEVQGNHNQHVRVLMNLNVSLLSHLGQLLLELGYIKYKCSHQGPSQMFWSLTTFAELGLLSVYVVG